MSETENKVPEVSGEDMLNDLDKENMIRLRSEVHILMDRLRRYAIKEYKAKFAKSKIEGVPLNLRTDAEKMNEIAWDAAQRAFRPKLLGSGSDERSV